MSINKYLHEFVCERFLYQKHSSFHLSSILVLIIFQEALVAYLRAREFFFFQRLNLEELD